MDILDIHAKLATLRCRADGESFSGEPYLWTVFFKIDGSSCRVTADYKLAGSATVLGSTGRSHGNLGTSDVDSGKTVPIPPALGEFATRLVPIPLDVPVLDVSEVDGWFGVVTVLLEEDQTSEGDVANGQRELATAIREQLNGFIATRSLVNRAPTDAETQAIKDAVESRVRDAIENSVGAWDWLSGFGDMDDFIGSAFSVFSHSQLSRPGLARITLPIRQRWTNEGDWEIRGTVSAENPAAVTIYREQDFRGQRQRLPAGRHNVGQLALGNDRVRSVRVPPGWRVTLFAESNFWGASLVLTSDSPLVGDPVNGGTSSIVVEGPFVTVYEHAGFQGRSQLLPVGRHDHPLEVGNDQVSSIRVPLGLRATLYSEARFWGDSTVVDANASYIGNAMNDRTSSIVVEPAGA